MRLIKNGNKITIYIDLDKEYDKLTGFNYYLKKIKKIQSANNLSMEEVKELILNNVEEEWVMEYTDLTDYLERLLNEEVYKIEE